MANAELTTCSNKAVFLARAYAYKLLRVFVLLLVSALLGRTGQAAAAATSGNAVLRNTVTVSYNDAYNQTPASATTYVDLFVITVAAQPTVTFIPGSGSTATPGSTQNYSVRVMTNSNGPRLVSLGVTDYAATTNMTNKVNGVPVASPTLPASVFLGATIVDPSDTHGTIASWPNGSVLTFNVPNDGGAATDAAETGGSANDGVINGLQAGDTVFIIDGTHPPFGPLQVIAVSDPAAGSASTVTTGTLQLKNLGSDLATLGYSLATSYAQIVEYKELPITVTQGDVTDATKYSDWTTTVSATQGTAPTVNANVVTQSHKGQIAVTKLVRNVTTGAAGSGKLTLNINGGARDYYQSGINGKPGETLEYLVVVSDSGTGDAQGVSVSDPLPSYTTLVTNDYTGSGGSGAPFALAQFNGAEVGLTTGNSGVANNLAYGAVSAGPPQLLQFWIGTGCTSSAGGTLNSSFDALRTTTTAYLIYQVKLN